MDDDLYNELLIYQKYFWLELFVNYPFFDLNFLWLNGIIMLNADCLCLSILQPTLFFIVPWSQTRYASVLHFRWDFQCSAGQLGLPHSEWYFLFMKAVEGI